MNCGNNPVEVLNFFQASSRNCINCVHCDDFSLLLLLLLRVRDFLETFFFIKLSFFYSCSENTMPKRISELYTNFIWLLDLRNKGLLYACCLTKKNRIFSTSQTSVISGMSAKNRKLRNLHANDCL